jgi:hypothetical protein
MTEYIGLMLHATLCTGCCSIYYVNDIGCPSLRCRLLEVKGRGFVCVHYLMGGVISNLGPYQASFSLLYDGEVELSRTLARVSQGP